MLRERMAWQMTHSEVYESIYAAVKSLASSPYGAIAAQIDSAVYLINSPTQIRQGVSVEDLFVSTPKGWVPIPVEVVDEWANSFGIVGPSEHFTQVEQAMKEAREVPPDVLEDFKRWAGLGPGATRDARKKQDTRVVDRDGKMIGVRQLCRPNKGDLVDYRMPHGDITTLTVESVRGYRNFDKAWRISVSETDEQFIVNLWRTNGEFRWIVQTRKAI